VPVKGSTRNNTASPYDVGRESPCNDRLVSPLKAEVGGTASPGERRLLDIAWLARDVDGREITDVKVVAVGVGNDWHKTRPPIRSIIAMHSTTYFLGLGLGPLAVLVVGRDEDGETAM